MKRRGGHSSVAICQDYTAAPPPFSEGSCHFDFGNQRLGAIPLPLFRRGGQGPDATCQNRRAAPPPFYPEAITRVKTR